MSLNSGNIQGDSDRLDALWASYREACPDPEPDPNFMPRLWQRIESRQTFALSIGHLARVFVTVAAAICVLMTVALISARPHHLTGFDSGTYVEMLAAEQAPEGLDLSDVTHGEEGNY
jgi:hypothetical protein